MRSDFFLKSDSSSAVENYHFSTRDCRTVKLASVAKLTHYSLLEKGSHSSDGT